MLVETAKGDWSRYSDCTLGNCFAVVEEYLMKRDCFYQLDMEDSMRLLLEVAVVQAEHTD
jgi:hypothetical protein